MNDYTWPSIFFSYLFFALLMGVAVFFFVRSCKDGYLGKDSEDLKYQVFEDPEQPADLRTPGRRSSDGR